MINEVERLKTYLLSNGLRYTKQREVILLEFLKARGHITAAELYKKVSKSFSKIGFATVYRTLSVLKKCGIAEEKSFGEGISRFEKTAKKNHHDHLVCESCGNIIEFCSPEIEHLQEEIAQKYNFQILRHNLDIYGLCEKCKKNRRF